MSTTIDAPGEQEITPASEEMEEVQPRELPEPELPSLEVQRQHRLVHVPFAAWCEDCVKAKAKDAPHFRRSALARHTESPEEPPVVQVDYTVIGQMEILTLYAMTLGAGAATAVKNNWVPRARQSASYSTRGPRRRPSQVYMWPSAGV